MSEFKREHDRYIVIKRSDLTQFQATDIYAYIDGMNIQTRECVVVESDWPIYKEVWKMVERMANNIPQMSQEYQAATLKEYDKLVKLDQKFNEATSELHAVKVALSKKEQELLNCHMDIDKLFEQRDQQENNLKEATKLINTQSESISKLKQDNDNYQLLVPSLDKLVTYAIDRQLGTPNEDVVDVIISYCEKLREEINDPNPAENGFYKVRTHKEGSKVIAFFELHKGWSFISDEEKYQSVYRVIEKVEV